MSIDQSALTSTGLLGRLDAAVPGSVKKDADPDVFKFLLQSRFGIDGEVLRKEKGLDANMITGMEMLSSDEASEQSGAALGALGFGGASLGGMGGLGGLDMLHSSALATLSKLSDDPSVQNALAERGMASGAASGSVAGDGTETAQGEGEVRMAVQKNQVRLAVNRAARHPDDLGRLSKVAAAGPDAGFTESEEQLILAAAGAETLLADASRDQSQARSKTGQPVPASSLERAAGALSAQYESNGEVDCVAYDRVGGTSYGKYQIASKPGTMKEFIEFLGTKAPDIAVKLKAAGPADTGGKSGRMPAVWKEIAAADPARFEALQHEFVRENNYSPAVKSIVLTSGLDVSQRSYALREVLWSTAVQHGPNGAERIFSKAADQVAAKGSPEDYDKALIEEVYRLRSQQFGRHSRRVRAAVQARFRNEKDNAIALLAQNTA